MIRSELLFFAATIKQTTQSKNRKYCILFLICSRCRNLQYRLEPTAACVVQSVKTEGDHLQCVVGEGGWDVGGGVHLQCVVGEGGWDVGGGGHLQCVVGEGGWDVGGGDHLQCVVEEGGWGVRGGDHLQCVVEEGG